MQKQHQNGFDPQRIPKDILIEILSRRAEDAFNIALVCRVWSQLVKLERYWRGLVQLKLKSILGGIIDEERLKCVDVFCNAPYDLLVGQIQPLSLRQRVGWMFPQSQVTYRCAELSSDYCFFFLLDIPIEFLESQTVVAITATATTRRKDETDLFPHV